MRSWALDTTQQQPRESGFTLLERYLVHVGQFRRELCTAIESNALLMVSESSLSSTIGAHTLFDMSKVTSLERSNNNHYPLKALAHTDALVSPAFESIMFCARYY